MADSFHPTSPGRKQTRKRPSYARQKNDADDLDDFEEESGRASRARTKLIVDGFSTLALIATFLAGSQAQLLSDTNDDNEGALSIATSAAFFGGLIFSVFTAILATLSGRWFSILREDDADYLSSRWLAQDSKLRIDDIEGGSRRLGPDLKEYLDFQIRSLQNTRLKKLGINPRRGTAASAQLTTHTEALIDGLPPRFESPEPTGASTDEKLNLDKAEGSFDPLVFDIECILNLLQKERTGEDVDLSKLEYVPEVKMARTTWKERALGWALLSPLVVCIPSFVLFTAGILLMAWDKQPRSSYFVFVLCSSFSSSTDTNIYTSPRARCRREHEFTLDDEMPPESRRATVEIADNQTRIHAEPTSTLIHRAKRHHRRSTLMSVSTSMNIAGGDIGDGVGGRATRQRTQLIVEGFSNLALVAVLFSGLIAQLLQIVAEPRETQNSLDVATNVAFFGGLVLSVFSTMLASLSGRWFSILREDDSEYLSSCWLAAECNERHPRLKDYVRFQLRLWEKRLSEDGEYPEAEDKESAASTDDPEDMKNPKDEDIKRILQLLQRDKEQNEGKSTGREIIMSKVLLSAIWICSGAFVLFCAGIVMFVWNKQHVIVAVLTSIMVFVCISFIPMFFLKHRRKHVISHFNLKRPAF
ncbi:putative transmembrane protein [Rhizoctonia solani 123E]|uniref:Putative transmembrane protein n=1 Tax=Rhizoctonia solani 123E TaxID=1423351 RepID=A0A074S282_9AGAM|nr:putative transmembrane protein [Rhizoctonia solani 123E]